MKKLILVLLLSVVASPAFAKDSQQKDRKDITFTVRLAADGEEMPNPISLIGKDGSDLKIEASLGKGSTPQNFDFKVVPEIENGVLLFKGDVSSSDFSSSEKGEGVKGYSKSSKKHESAKVDTKLVNGKEKTLSYKLNGHEYVVKVVAKF